MEIRFISTLTAEDEKQMAPALMNSVTALLDALPIAYTLRIETLGAQVFQHTHSAPEARSAVVEASHGMAGSEPAYMGRANGTHRP